MKTTNIILVVIMAILLVSTTVAWPNPVFPIPPIDSPAYWDDLENQVIPYGSPDNTVVYEDINDYCHDNDHPEIVAILNPHHANYDLVLLNGEDIVIKNLNPGYYGTETIFLDCNAASASFQLTVYNAPPVANAGPDQTVDVNQNVDFDGSASYDPDGTIVSYVWDFGDGPSLVDRDTATGSHVTHAFVQPGTYTVTLTVMDNLGVTSQDTAIINVLSGIANQPPIADAGPDRTVAVNAFVNFDGSNSSDPDGTIASYQWNFGDGTTANGVVVSHTFTSDGIYLVTLTVTDNLGATGVDTAVIIVDGVPTAVAGGPYYGNVGEPMQFDASQSTDDTQIVLYRWDWGDGWLTDATGPLVYHTYNQEGAYQITLTVFDNNNLQNTDTTVAYVTVVEPVSTKTERTIFNRIRHDDRVYAGDILPVNVGIFNDGSYEMEDVKVTAYIFGVEERRTVGPVDIEDGEEEMFRLYLDIPADTQPGDYDLRIMASNDHFRHLEHRIVTIV